MRINDVVEPQKLLISIAAVALAFSFCGNHNCGTRIMMIINAGIVHVESQLITVTIQKLLGDSIIRNLSHAPTVYKAAKILMITEKSNFLNTYMYTKSMGT